MLYAKCLYDFAYMLYAPGEKVDMQEKQPNRITKKVEYPQKNKVNEQLRPVINKTCISSTTDNKLSKDSYYFYCSS